MLLIPCPWCGPREEIEFRHGGEGVPLPVESSDAEWARVLYYRGNPAGAQEERWVHVNGCRQWFFLTRNTMTHEITGSRKLNEPPSAATSARVPDGAQPTAADVARRDEPPATAMGDG